MTLSRGMERFNTGSALVFLIQMAFPESCGSFARNIFLLALILDRYHCLALFLSVSVKLAMQPRLFQYTTAFHWALTQMTPGSMQARPACDKGLTPCLREPCISIPPQCLDFLPGSEVPSPAAGLPQELAGASEPKPAGKSTSHATLCRAYRNLGLNIRSPNSFSSKHNFPQLEASDALTHGNFGYPSFPLPDCVLA